MTAPAGNLRVVTAVQQIESRKSDSQWKESLKRLIVKISELALFKPTLQLSDEQKLLWAQEFLRVYSVDHVIQAIEVLKHRSDQFLNFGNIAEEVRKIEARSSRDYRPNFDPGTIAANRLTTGQHPNQKMLR